MVVLSHPFLSPVKKHFVQRLTGSVLNTYTGSAVKRNRISALLKMKQYDKSPYAVFMQELLPGQYHCFYCRPLSINDPYSRAESGITCLWDGIDCFCFLFAIATERLNEEDTRVDWDAQLTGMHNPLLH